MWEMDILGYNLYSIFYLFVIYSFIGWVWEVFYVFLRTDQLVNRGFVNGPFCPIYGFGASFVYLALSPVESSLFLLFVYGAALATVVEYVSAAIMEQLFHATWWDYSDRKYNLKGRVCLSVSMGWGFFSVVLMKIIHPGAEEFIKDIPFTLGIILAYVIIIVFFADFFYTFYYIKKFNRKLERMSINKEELKDKFENSRIFEATEEVLHKLEQSDNEYIDELRKRIGKIKESSEESKERIERFIDDTKKYKQLYNKLFKDRNYVEKRIMKAFPKLKSLKNKDILNEIKQKYSRINNNRR